ncbi:DRTGG domain-containing protein [Lachnospiraceae bacterium KM106-2]|nr:DRTGG domain-containing protein [Lachnospiraceae bacterium KM106-2]
MRTVRELIQNEDFTVVNEGNSLDTKISQPFCCDLLSFAMSRAPVDCAWVTVMANINTLAVAKLTDSACIILAEGVTLDNAALKKAREQQVTILSTHLPIYDAAVKVEGFLHG